MQCNVQVQVISVEESYAQGGCKKIMLTISDGVRLLRCGVLPNLFHLIKSKTVSMYSIVRINQVLLSEICRLNMVLFTDMDPVSQLDSLERRSVFHFPSLFRWVLDQNIQMNAMTMLDLSILRMIS